MLNDPNIVKIAVLVSGNGSNLQALIDAQAAGDIPKGNIVMVLSSSSDAYALVRAQDAGINTSVVERKSFTLSEQFDHAILTVLRQCEAEVVVLAGFMSLLGTDLINEFKDRIINVHPSLIPSFCGKGCYGIKVHRDVLESGVKITGATVHFVNEIPDGGKIICQKAVEVDEDDTPETLQKKVMSQAEWEILPKATADLCEKIYRDKALLANKENSYE